MKILTIIGIATVIAASSSVFAADLEKVEIQNVKERPQIISVISSNGLLATVKLAKSATLALEAESITSAKSVQSGVIWNCKGKAKLQMLVDCKPGLTMSGDTIAIQERDGGRAKAEK